MKARLGLHSTARNTTVLVTVLCLAGTPVFASTVKAEDAAITGAGPVISIDSIPVILPSGQVVYRDVTVTLSASDTGNVTATISSAASREVTDDSFVAGTYEAQSPSGGPFIIHVSGPSLTPSGLSAWSMEVTKDGNGCTYPSSAIWYSGGNPAGSPVANMVAASHLQPGLADYGTQGAAHCVNGIWGAANLVGVQQAGNHIVFTSYASGHQVGTISYQRIGQ